MVINFLLVNSLLSPKIEGRFPEITLDELQRRGHRLYVKDDWTIGCVSACAKESERLLASANPRFIEGYAMGRGIP